MKEREQQDQGYLKCRYTSVMLQGFTRTRKNFTMAFAVGKRKLVVCSCLLGVLLAVYFIIDIYQLNYVDVSFDANFASLSLSHNNRLGVTLTVIVTCMDLEVSTMVPHILKQSLGSELSMNFSSESRIYVRTNVLVDPTCLD